MNNTLNELHAFLTQDLGPERLLLVPSKTMGSELLDAYAAAYKGVMGLRVETPFSLARELCSRTGAARPTLSTPQATLMVYDLLKAYLEDPGQKDGYFSSLGMRSLSLGTARSLLQLFYLLEENEAVVRPDPGENPRLKDLVLLFDAYCAAKEAQGLWDIWDMLRCALELVRSGKAVLPPVAACTDLTGRGLVRELILALAPTPIPVPCWDQIQCPQSAFPLEQPSAPCTAQLRFCQCHGTDNDTRFPFRDVLENKYPLGEVAIVCTGGALLPKLYAHACALGLPVTLEQGLRLSDAPLTQLLEQLLAWFEHRCPVEELYALTLDGLTPPHAFSLMGQLQQNLVGFEQSRYLAFLNGLDQTHPHKEAWSEFFTQLFALAAPATSAREGYAILWKLLTHHYIPGDPQKRALEFTSLMNLGGQVLDQLEGRDFRSYLTVLLKLTAQASYLSAQPRDGAIHILPLSRASLLNRKHVYVVGLQQTSLERRSIESPLLRDEERKAAGLPGSDAEALMPTYQFGQLLGSREADSTLVLSYAGYDLMKDMQLHPSPLYLSLLGKNTEEQFNYIPTVGFTPADRYLCTGTAPDSLKVDFADPNAAPDPNAAAAVPGTPPEADPVDTEAFVREHNFSASALEIAMDCPMHFYFQYVLKIPQPPQEVLQENCWLPANRLGTVVHTIMERYYNAVIDGQNPNLDDVAKAVLAQAELDYPCLRPDLMEPDRKKILGMCHQAKAHLDGQAASGRRPLACELDFGAPNRCFSGKLDGVDLTLPESVVLDLSDPNAAPDPNADPNAVQPYHIHFNGSVDRLDLLSTDADGTRHYCILDYKTGSAHSFMSQLDHKLQYYLYAKAVEQLLGGKVDRAEYLLLTDSSFKVCDFADPAQDAQCADRVRQLLDELADREACKTCVPSSDCVRYCPYYLICKEAKHD